MQNHKRQLGNEGLEVPALGLGCMGMTVAYGALDDEKSVATIRRAADLGYAFLDTADAYGQGKNESLVGKAIKGIRDRVIIGTKFGNRRNAADGRKVDGRPEYVVAACENSLTRLGIDYLDIFYQHRVDPGVPIEDTVGAMGRLVEAGKVRYLGLSEAGDSTVRKAHSTFPISALQTEYSLWTRDVEDSILPTCRELGIGFVAYSPLGRGFLTGRIRAVDDLIANDRRRAHPRFSADNIASNKSLLEPLDEVADARGKTPSQIALAWLLGRGQDIVPIPGCKHIAHLEQNIAALDISLDNDEIAKLEAAYTPGITAGDRYPEQQMRGLGL